MAGVLTFADGFDQYGGDFAGLQQSFGFTTGCGLSNVTPRTGAWCVAGQGNGQLAYVLPNAVPKAILGFGYYGYRNFLDYQTYNVCAIGGFIDSNGGSIMVQVDSLGRLTLFACGDGRWSRGDWYGFLAQSGNAVLQPNQYYWIEIAVSLAADNVSNSEIAVRVNGDLVIDFQGVFAMGRGHGVCYGTLASTYHVLLGDNAGNNNYIDDYVVVTGDTFPGDRRCIVLQPDEDTAQADWTITGGATGWQCLSNTPPIDGDYISTPTIGAQSNFDLSDLPNDAASALGIMLFVRSEKSDAGACQITPGFITGGGENDAAALSAPAGTMAWNSAPIGNNPVTGAPYTVAEINAGVISIKRTA